MGAGLGGAYGLQTAIVFEQIDPVDGQARHDVAWSIGDSRTLNQPVLNQIMEIALEFRVRRARKRRRVGGTRVTRAEELKYLSLECAVDFHGILLIDKKIGPGDDTAVSSGGTTMIIATYLLIFCLLLLLNALFVLAEFAAVKVRGSQIEEMVDRGVHGARLAQQIHANLDEYLSVVQVGITLASVALGFVGERTAADLLLPVLSGHGSVALAHTIATTVSVILVSALHIVLGEQVPKLVAIRKAERLAIITAYPLRVAHYVFFVPLWILNRTAQLVLHTLGMGNLPKHEQVSEDELRIILERSQSSGMMSFRRLLFMENIFDMGELRVKDAMRIRTHVQCLRADMSWDEVEQFIADRRYSRYPIITDNPDCPAGFVHVKDLLQARCRLDGVDLRKLIRPLIATTEQTGLETLLVEMQQKRCHIALVLSGDQWTGFLTMEDVIEEIIGTIGDEFETDPPVRLGDVLNPSRIVLNIEAHSIVDAVRQALTRIPGASLPAPAETLVRAIAERERLASTYLGRGIAMPHARLADIAVPSVFLVRSQKGIPVEGKAERARLLFVLITPAGQPRVHQKLQIQVVKLMEYSDYVEDRLHDAPTPQEVFDVIRTGEEASID